MIGPLGAPASGADRAPPAPGADGSGRAGMLRIGAGAASGKPPETASAPVDGSARWPVLRAGATIAGVVLRPAEAATASEPAAVQVRILAVPGPAPAVVHPTAATTAQPAGLPATILALGADGRPIIGAAGTLVRLDAGTVLPAGADLIVDLDVQRSLLSPDSSVDGSADAAAAAQTSSRPGLTGVLTPLLGFFGMLWQAGRGRDRAAGTPDVPSSASAPDPSLDASPLQPTSPEADETDAAAARPAEAAAESRATLAPDLAHDLASLRLVIDPDEAPPAVQRTRPRGQGFALAVRLSRLGLVELEARIDPRGRRCDLIVRTEAPLPGGAHAELRTLFAVAGDVTGRAGALAFARTRPDPR
jgi:hypothetical protein